MNSILKLATIALALTIFGGAAMALDQATFEARISAITDKYEPRLEALSRQADALNNDMPSEEEIILNVGEWEEVHFSMDIPEFRMERWGFSMHIPETSMKHRDFSWHVPECRWDMVDFGIGKTKFLKCGKKLHKWSTKVPEFTMNLREFSMDIPEVTMKRREFSLHLPKVDVGGPRDKIESIKSEGEVIQTEVKALSAQMEAEMGLETRAFLTAQRIEVEKQFQFVLDTLGSGINSAPNSAVRAELTTQRDTALRQRAQVLAEIDAQMNALA